MRIRRLELHLLIAVAALLGSGCADVPRADSDRRPEAVQIYDMDPYVGKGYDIVGRVWADSRRAVFWIPTYSTKDQAIASMQAEAARLNADALISVSCVDQRGSTWFRKDEPAFFCYGVAIQLRHRQG